MNKVSIPQTLLIKSISYLQIVGGFLGIIMGFIVLFKAIHQLMTYGHVNVTVTAILIFTPLVYLFIFLLTIRASILLMRFARSGYRLSLFIQLLQLPIIISPTLSYHLRIGAEVALGYFRAGNTAGWHWKADLGSYYWFQLGAPILAHGFFINVLALTCMVILIIYWPRQHKTEASN